MSANKRYAKERPDFILYVSGQPIGLGELPVYFSREHAVNAAVRLGLAVPINIVQTDRVKPRLCETIQPTPELIAVCIPHTGRRS